MSDQIINYTFHHIGGSGLTWVHSGAQDDSLLLFHSLLWITKRSNRQHINLIPSVTLAQHFSSKPIFSQLVIFQVAEISLQVSIGVWVAVRKVHGVFIMVKLHSKGQSVIMSSELLLQGILIVTDVFAYSLPAFSQSHCIGIRIHQRLHPVVVQAIGLQKIDNVESVFLVFSGVLNSKVKPLIVHFSIIIWFQDQIIFKFIHLDSSSEVSRFKPRFKAQSIISFGLGNIKLIKGLIIVTVINRRQI